MLRHGSHPRSKGLLLHISLLFLASLDLIAVRHHLASTHLGSVSPLVSPCCDMGLQTRKAIAPKVANVVKGTPRKSQHKLTLTVQGYTFWKQHSLPMIDVNASYFLKEAKYIYILIISYISFYY
jgi:hypothetical protein